MRHNKIDTFTAHTNPTTATMEHSQHQMKISHSGLLARSPEGHAARGGLSIKGNEDVWVEIQANTFRNWVNENLPSDLKVIDLAQDLCTGVRLCTLVEKLQGKTLRGWNRRPVNQHHYLENVACALSSVEGDGVKLVNIGNLDIVNGNLKLILGLIWSLIVRYQIGRSKFPPRKLMLAWLQAVLPECKVNNLTTDWNSGVLLSALVDYCRPGLFSHWRRLDKHNGINNCRNAMDIAQKQLGIPAVLEPEYLASPWLDELSGMTYLSYFMKPGSPGFYATLRWVNSRLDRSVKNFTSDWNDGKAISEIIRSLGGSATAPEKLRSDPAYWESNLTQAVEAGKRLGVQPVLLPKDMADHNVEHLGVMAYTAYFQWIPERPPLHDLVNVKIDSTSGRVGELTRYQITLLSDQLSYSKVSAEIRAPDNRYYTAKTLRDGSGTYIPQKVGMHELIVRYEGEEVSTKHYFRALPPLVEVVPPGMAPCALGSIVQVLVNATGAPKREDILVTAFSPLGRPLECPLTTIDGTNTATFKPDEAGIWRIEITYQGKHIQGGPFTCAVFDPNGVVVSGLEGALPMVPHAIDLDCRDVCVPGEVYADVVYDKRSLHTRMERVDIDGYLHRVHFTPVNPGKHRVYVYFNGYDVKGSPFMMRVGTQRRSKHNAAADVRSTTNEAKPGIYTVSPVQEHHTQSHSKYLSSERRVSADSPAFDTLGAASFIPRASSPSLAPRTQSPTFRPQSPNFRPLSPLRPGSPHHMMSSSSLNTNMKQTSSSSHILRSKSPDYTLAHSPSLITSRLLNNKLSSSPRASPVNMNRDDYSSSYQLGKMRLANRSPGLQELRSNSPDYGYSSTTRYNKSMTEQRSYNNSFDKIESNYSNGLNPVVKFPSSPSPSPVGGRRLESWDVVGRTNDALEQQQHQVMRSRDYSYKAGVGMSRVGGATAVKVQDIPDGVVGRPVEFEIDGSGAGSGDLEILVEGGRVTSSVRSLGGQRFRAAFTPHQALPHRVDIRFNGETVPGSPWHTNIMPSSASASVLGDATRLVPARAPANFEIITNSSTTPSLNSPTADLTVYVIAPSKRAVPSKVVPSSARPGVQSVEFTPTEVGTHVIEVSVNGEKLASGPLIAKVYDAGLIQVADVSGGVVGQPVQFRVDASQAGEGQLEISINEGEVPNHVQVVGGGRCLVSFTPDVAKPHLIDIKFNGETITGCPFICTVADTSRVTLSLAHLELIPVNQTSSFHMGVAGGGAAELAVAVRGPVGELPVKVTGDIHSGFTAEFTPNQVGAHQISVDYNSRPVQGTPFVAKAFDSTRVTVGQVARGTVGRPVTFSVDASEAGEGNLEITISARGLNIPTQVHPQGNAKFAVSFVPAEACDHVVNVAFNKRPVVGCPLIVGVGGGGQGPSVTLPGPGPVNRASTLLINHPGRLEDIEVNVEGPGGQAVPTQVQPLGNAQFRAEFVPRVVGEHRITVSVNDVQTAGSPYAAKVYDVQAIRVKEASTGVVGKPVTFLVETSQAGPGNLEVTVNGGRVPTSAQAQGPHTYAISFTPREATAHSVDLRFNGQDVPGSPFQCAVSAAARVMGVEALDKVSVGRSCGFGVESPNPPVVEVLGPARRQVATQVTPQSAAPGKFDVTFTPLDVGDHSVEVRLPGGHIDGSPFLIKAYDAQRVSVTDINDGIVGKPVSFSINASQAGAGNLEIIVAVAGRNVPNFVQSEGNARFKVNFKPTEAAVHTLSVRFNGQAVPGSPFSCKVSPGNTQPRIPVSGSGIELAAISHPAEIKIEGVPGVEPQVIATAPNGKMLNTKLTSTTQDSYVARFTPEAVGRHSVAILINDQHVIGSPFNCNVYDVNKVIVSGLPGNSPASQLNPPPPPKPHPHNGAHASTILPPAEVGKPVTFSVDAAQAGEGTLELVVSTQHTTIKAEVVACARGLYDVTFVPQTGEDHYVNITFNDTNVAGSPFHCAVVEGTQYMQVASLVSIDVPPSHRIEIRDANEKPVKYTMNNNGKAEFNAAQTGTYQITVSRISDSEVLLTRTIHVFDTSKIDVINAPPEVICHRPSVVGVNVNKAGPGALTARVTCASKDVAHSVRQSASSNSPHMYDIVFHPVHAAPHKIVLLYNGVPKAEVLEVGVRAAAQEPWACGLGLYQGRVGKVNTFNIDTLGRPAREFDIIVSTPGGNALPVRCYQTKTGRLQAEFTARDIGEHTVEVLQAAKPLAGSPFTCDVFDVDAVRIVDVPHVQGNVGEKIVFNVSTKSAGHGLLTTNVTNPIQQPILVTQTPSPDDPNLTMVSFIPTAAGLYQATVTYGGFPVKGSPLALGVGPVGPTPPPRAVGKALELGVVGERCGFSVSSAGQPRVQIEAIEGTVDAQVQCTKPGEWLITYTPKWVGVYDIIIGIGGTDLPGSPFRPTIVNPSAVRLIGGWAPHMSDSHTLLLPTKLVFDTTNAGPGQLTCSIAGRNIPVDKNNQRWKLDLNGEGLNSGDHELEVRFSGAPLGGDTPRKVSVVGGVDEVILTGRGLQQVQCGEVAVVGIDGSKAASGNPEVTLHSADSNLPIPVMISLAGEKNWRASYTINTPGNYLLSVLWNGRPVKGCPLMVEAKGGADASKVLCSGEGLRQGIVGREIRSWIDTRRAGPGELTAHCTGPRKVAYCELYDHGDATFTLNVKPQEPGRHALTIKYAGQHVNGSPFTLRVAGAPDASKVRVYGPGIEHGVLATFQSRFICDTRGAGAGQLTVRVRGPKGAFRVEMQRESQKDRTILNKYDPTEPGDYRVEVKWAGELVPGSPFHVMIFDTQEELRRYINSIN